MIQEKSLDCPFILIQRLSCNKFLIGNLIAADGLGEVVVEEATAPKRQSLDCPFILIQRLSCSKFLIGNLIAADGLGEVVGGRKQDSRDNLWTVPLYRYRAGLL